MRQKEEINIGWRGKRKSERKERMIKTRENGDFIGEVSVEFESEPWVAEG